MKNRLSLRGNRKPFYGLLSAVFLSLFMLSAAVFTACDKENPISGDQVSQNELKNDTSAVDFEVVAFSYNGKLYPKDEFQKMFKDFEFPYMVAGAGLAEQNIVYVFDKQESFKTWAATTPFSEKLIRASNLISEAKPKDDLNKSLHVGSITATGGWAKLYLNDSNTGSYIWAPVTTTYSSLYPYNNMVSSVTLYNPAFGTFPAFSICALYSSTYYYGYQLILINNVSNNAKKFKMSNFILWDNLAQSCITL